jgi:hypothetical protein
MFDRSGNLSALARMHVTPATMALLALTIATGAAWSQPAPSPSTPAPLQQAVTGQPASPQAEPAPPPSPPAREENPGLIHEIGKMFDKLPTLKSTGQNIDEFNARAKEAAKDAAKDATDTLSRLAKPLVVSGRMICPASANGAPDCKTASDKLCQANAFKEGKSLTTDSAETCSARVLIPGRARKPDDCRTDTYVTRALCQ